MNEAKTFVVLCPTIAGASFRSAEEQSFRCGDLIFVVVAGGWSCCDTARAKYRLVFRVAFRVLVLRDVAESKST